MSFVLVKFLAADLVASLKAAEGTRELSPKTDSRINLTCHLCKTAITSIPLFDLFLFCLRKVYMACLIDYSYFASDIAVP